MEMNGPRNQSDADAEGDHQMTSAAEVPVGVEQSQSELQQSQQHRVSSRSTSPRSDGALTPTRRPRDEEVDGIAGSGPRGARRRVTDRSADPGEDAMDVSASGALPAHPAVGSFYWHVTGHMNPASRSNPALFGNKLFSLSDLPSRHKRNDGLLSA